MSRKTGILAAVALVFAVLALVAVGIGSARNAQTNPHKRLKMTHRNLPRLTDARYAAWIEMDGENVLMAQFNIGKDGRIENLQGKDQDTFDNRRDLGMIEGFFVTIEKQAPKNGQPSKTRVLESSVKENMFELSFPVDYANNKGSFIMATPTDPNVAENHGVWFMRLSDGGQSRGLNIPDAPEGWMYGAWIKQGDNPPIKIGKFSSPSSMDDFDGYSGDGPSPDFPGEDFINNPPDDYVFPLDVRGSQVWVTLEPDPSVSQEPFPITIFERTVSEEAETRSNIGMENVSNNMPSLKITVVND
ncbi:MAG: hypothetical protein ACYC1U_00325 [Candidatus Aquicultorales bacterium]